MIIFDLSNCKHYKIVTEKLVSRNLVFVRNSTRVEGPHASPFCFHSALRSDGGRCAARYRGAGVHLGLKENNYIEFQNYF